MTLMPPIDVIGRLLMSLPEDIESWAPLKPQQQLFALKSYLIPSFYHQLVLGSVTITVLSRERPSKRRPPMLSKTHKGSLFPSTWIPPMPAKWPYASVTDPPEGCDLCGQTANFCSWECHTANFCGWE